MASIGASDGYYTNVVINSDGSITTTYMPTFPGGQPSPTTYTAQMVQQSIDFLLPYVTAKTYPSGTFTPYHAMALTVAVQKGQVSASQLDTWYAGNNMAVGGVQGYTSYDNAGPGTVAPSASQIATSTTMLGVNTSDSTTMNAVQQTVAQMTAASKNLPVLTANQQLVEKMYLAAFLRAPEKGGLDYWVGKLNAGDSLTKVGDVIFSLDIVKAIYADTMSNQQFVTAIYNNVFGKAPDSSGLDYWTGKLDSSGHRGDLVMDMINAGLGTALGTPGRDYIINRFDTVHYAVQNQVKTGVELGVTYLKNLTAAVGADAASITTYQQSIDTTIAASGGTSSQYVAQDFAAPVEIIGTSAVSVEAVFG